MNDKLKKILDRFICTEHDILYTHRGFIKTMLLNFEEVEEIDIVITSMLKHSYCIKYKSFVFIPYSSGYNGGTVVAGIKKLKTVSI